MLTAAKLSVLTVIQSNKAVERTLSDGDAVNRLGERGLDDSGVINASGSDSRHRNMPSGRYLRLMMRTAAKQRTSPTRKKAV